MGIIGGSGSNAVQLTSPAGLPGWVFTSARSSTVKQAFLAAVFLFTVHFSITTSGRTSFPRLMW